MAEIEKQRVGGIDIYDYTENGFMPAMKFGSWRVAYLNHDDCFDEKNFVKLEKHLETDEVFVLLEGKATLIIGEEMTRIEMEQHKVYNVPVGVWHHIFTTEGTRVLIVENEDTGMDNAEFLFV
ncbi:MAG: hypothetical protein E7409_06135 [Ruminococcaceae bacterium]|nr:hypothetical protein [Oscillospiraceae bacterium]